MAHQDDFEFNAGGLFAMLRKKYGREAELKILATSRGASGHHVMGPEETFRRREKEAQKSASLIGASYECLKCLDGSHVKGQVMIDVNVLGGIWNAVRDFEPDYIFCPPVISDPLAGIHIDHYNTAWAVRMLAYQFAVPNAYPTLNGPVKKKVILPAILNVYDPYAMQKDCDIALDISGVFEDKIAMALCHESQIFEWLPWVGGQKAPTKKTYKGVLRKRHTAMNQNLGLPDDLPREIFVITKWGRTVNKTDIRKLFPGESAFSRTVSELL